MYICYRIRSFKSGVFLDKDLFAFLIFIAVIALNCFSVNELCRLMLNEKKGKLASKLS